MSVEERRLQTGNFSKDLPIPHSHLRKPLQDRLHQNEGGNQEMSRLGIKETGNSVQERGKVDPLVKAW